ncbi:MAG: peptidyl-alpha-hydroxyglycine alpha-amidating lyase family protein [Gemmatimonadota bacterium]
MVRLPRLALASAATLFALPAIPTDAQIIIPNPYAVADSTFGELPEGRSWGAMSAVYTGPDGRTIWAMDRCGANGCVGREEVDMIFRFDLEGRLLQSFGAGLLAVPHGMHVDRDGNVWVVDTAWLGARREGVGHVVRKFTADGELLMTLGEWGVEGDGPSHFTRPSDVLVAPDGNIFVADGHDNDGNNRIVKFSPDGRFLMEFGTTGSGIGEFRDPHALALDSQGRLFVGDRGNKRIQIFDQEGNHLATWTQFGSPSGIYIDADDTIYVADSDSNSTRNPGWRRGIYIGSARDGWVTAFIQDPEPNPDGGVTSGAEGVAVDAEGSVYGAEVGPRTLRKHVRR